MSPKISIIIPLYNQYNKLLKCLESIKKQTFTDFEIIIVNDGSTDIEHNELERVVSCQLAVVSCFYQENQGAPSARNRGFKESHGKYIIFCDADIVMQPDMLEKMNHVLDENPDISYAYSSFKFGFKKFKLWEFDADRLRKMPYIHTTSLIRREHFTKFDPNLKRLQDWDLWLSILEKGYKGKWINEVLFKVKSGGSISRWLPKFLMKHNSEYIKSTEIIKQKHKFL